MTDESDNRCTIYLWSGLPDRKLTRCLNNGTHWVEHTEPSGESDFFDQFSTWECDGPCVFKESDAESVE